MNYRILILSIFVLSLLTNCNNDNTTNPTDPGNYESVNIGTQVWMLKNLDVDHYRNGDPIPQVTDPDRWANLTTGAWCYYYNDPENGKIYGKLYNWYAVNDPRGLAPEGWHVPSDDEWTTLENYLSNNSQYWCDNESCRIAKSLAATELWSTSSNTCTIGNNLSSNNQTGFTALPGGCRIYDGTFDDIGYIGLWWSASEYSSSSAMYRGLYYIVSGVTRYYDIKRNGFSVRCIRD